MPQIIDLNIVSYDFTNAIVAGDGVLSDIVNDIDSTNNAGAGGTIADTTLLIVVSSGGPDLTGSLSLNLVDTLSPSPREPVSFIITDPLSPVLEPPSLDEFDFLPGSFSSLPDVGDVDETDTGAVDPREPMVLSEPTDNTILSTVPAYEAPEMSALIQSVNYSLLLE